jgi:hypothetical protein
MLHLSLRQRITVLALLAALAVPWTSAAAPRVGQRPAGPGLLQQLWTALTGFWDAGANLDDGCRWDPDGRCRAQSGSTGPILTTQEDGCRMDPNGGHCIAGSISTEPTVTPDDGCRWDPNGHCLPGS